MCVGPVAVGPGPVENSEGVADNATVTVCPLASVLRGRLVLDADAGGVYVTVRQADNYSWFGYPEDTTPHSSRNFLPGLGGGNGKDNPPSNGGNGNGSTSSAGPASASITNSGLGGSTGTGGATGGGGVRAKAAVVPGVVATGGTATEKEERAGIDELQVQREVHSEKIARAQSLLGIARRLTARGEEALKATHASRAHPASHSLQPATMTTTGVTGSLLEASESANRKIPDDTGACTFRFANRKPLQQPLAANSLPHATPAAPAAPRHVPLAHLSPQSLLGSLPKTPWDARHSMRNIPSMQSTAPTALPFASASNTASAVPPQHTPYHPHPPRGAPQPPQRPPQRPPHEKEEEGNRPLVEVRRVSAASASIDAFTPHDAFPRQFRNVAADLRFGGDYRWLELEAKGQAVSRDPRSFRYAQLHHTFLNQKLL